MMKTIIKKSPVLILLIILFSNISIAQQEKINPGERQSQLSYEIPPEKSFTPQRKISAEEQKLTEQLMQAKQLGNGDEMLRIQKELDAYAGSVTMVGIPAGKSERIYGSLPPGQNINFNKVSDKAGIKAVATHREQTATSNRMWAVIVASSLSSVDTIYTLFSDDEGNNWNYFSRSYFPNTHIGTDEIDIEIVQTSSEKYIYIACALRLINGKRVIGLIVNRVVDASYGVTYLYWPGENSNDLGVIKYRPRITSDCAHYQYNGAWVYISCCQDSAVSGGYQTCVKVARIDNPYTPLPSTTFRSDPFFFNDFVTTPLDSYADLAYHKEGVEGYILVVQSNVPVNTNIYLTRSHILNFTTNISSYVGSLNGATTRQKRYAYVASNGYYPNLMITNIEIYSSDDWDIQYFSSTNGSLNWTTGYVDYSSDFAYRSEIIERKNVPGEFYTAFGVLEDFNRVLFCKSSGNTWGTLVQQMNHLNSSPNIVHPCFKSTGSDNCFAIWGESNYTNVWVSGGCSGTLTLNRNLQLNLFIQGRYRPTFDNMIGDTLQIQLRNNFSPYSIVGSAKGFQNSNGVGSYNFPAAVNGVNYYIVIKNRNSIETWSKSPGQSFLNNVLSYNFYTWAQAYGNNLVEVDDVPYRFGIYTGDVNQDGVIEAADVALIDNAAFNFASGYVLTDLTGNSFVDGSDYLIADNNAFSFVIVQRP